MTIPQTSDAGAAAPSPASRRSALQRITERLGGRQLTVAACAGRRQSTVSGWENRGVPADLALTIAQNARARGYALTAEEILVWIAEDRAAASRGGR